MNNYELEKYFDELGIPSEGRELIRKARRESPVRKVKSTGANVMSLFQSQKMGVNMAAESLHVEFSAMMTYEKDPEVLEFYPQPVRLEIPGNTKRENWHHTPDFLVLRREEIAIEEWRQEKRLIGLAQKHPQRYQSVNGGWVSPPVESLLADMGIRYDLRSADEHNQVYIDNLNFLRSYFREDSPPIDPMALDGMRKVLQQHPVLPLKSLIGAALGKPIEGALSEQEPIPPGFTVDDIYSAIGNGHITFDLYTDPLSDTLRSCLYADEVTLNFRRALPVRSDAPAAPAQLRFEPGFAISFTSFKL